MSIKSFSSGEILTASDTNTYLANSGLVYVNSKTFSGSGTVSCTDFFNSTYDNYKIVMSCTSASASAQIVETRLMSGATATSGTTNYKFYELGHTFAAGAPDAAAGSGGAYWFAFRSTDFFMGTMEIQNPYATNYTTYQAENMDSVQSVSSGGIHLLNTSYDGIQFLAGTGTLAGTVTCYGYRKP
jgi:hypothetical protein